MCFPLLVPNKYYPLILAAIFSLLFQPQFDLLVAMIVGYLYPSSTASTLNSNSCIHRVFKCLSHRTDFIQSSQLPMSSNSASSNQRVPSNANSNPPIREFEGRGVSIGTSKGQSKQTNQQGFIANYEKKQQQNDDQIQNQSILS